MTLLAVPERRKDLFLTPSRSTAEGLSELASAERTACGRAWCGRGSRKRQVSKELTMNFETLVAALLSTQPSLANKPSNTPVRRASDVGSDRGSPAPSVRSESRGGGGGHSPRSVGSMQVRRSWSSPVTASATQYVRQQRKSSSARSVFSHGASVSVEARFRDGVIELACGRFPLRLSIVCAGSKRATDDRRQR